MGPDLSKWQSEDAHSHYYTPIGAEREREGRREGGGRERGRRKGERGEREEREGEEGGKERRERE